MRRSSDAFCLFDVFRIKMEREEEGRAKLRGTPTEEMIRMHRRSS
jgi:hypothetical protein